MPLVKAVREGCSWSAGIFWYLCHEFGDLKLRLGGKQEKRLGLKTYIANEWSLVSLYI